MNSLFNFRVNAHFTLCDNINLDKLIKSIKTLNKINKIFKLENCSMSNPNDNQIYIFIEHGILICNFSHLHYDGYSICLIFNKIYHARWSVTYLIVTNLKLRKYK